MQQLGYPKVIFTVSMPLNLYQHLLSAFGSIPAGPVCQVETSIFPVEIAELLKRHLAKYQSIPSPNLPEIGIGHSKSLEEAQSKTGALYEMLSKELHDAMAKALPYYQEVWERRNIELEKAKDSVEREWRRIEDKVMVELPKITKRAWMVKEIICGFVYVSRPHADPLVLNPYYSLREVKMPTIHDLVMMLIHEILHINLGDTFSGVAPFGLAIESFIQHEGIEADPYEIGHAILDLIRAEALRRAHGEKSMNAFLPTDPDYKPHVKQALEKALKYINDFQAYLEDQDKYSSINEWALENIRKQEKNDE